MNVTFFILLEQKSEKRAVVWRYWFAYRNNHKVCNTLWFVTHCVIHFGLNSLSLELAKDLDAYDTKKRWREGTNLFRADVLKRWGDRNTECEWSFVAVSSSEDNYQQEMLHWLAAVWTISF